MITTNVESNATVNHVPVINFSADGFFFQVLLPCVHEPFLRLLTGTALSRASGYMRPIARHHRISSSIGNIALGSNSIQPEELKQMLKNTILRASGRAFGRLISRTCRQGVQICSERMDPLGDGRPQGYPSFSGRLAPYFRAP